MSEGRGSCPRPPAPAPCPPRVRCPPSIAATTGGDMLDAHQTARLGDTTADLSWIARSWPDLYQLRLPGTRRPRRGDLTGQAKADADVQARIERLEVDPDAPGMSPAPVDVGVLDTLTGLLMDIHDLAERICGTAGAVAPEPPSTGYDYPAIPRLCAAASAHLPEAAQADPEALDDAQQTAARLRTRLAGVLEEILDGQRLTAVCAWCRGTTVAAPAGGDRTMVVRLVASRPVIVCEGDLCNPPPNECGTWVMGRPAWPEHAWKWLARRLHAA